MNAVANIPELPVSKAVTDTGDLVLARGWGDRLAAAGVVRAEDLLSGIRGERLDKVGLPGWRQRLRVELPGVGRCYLKRYHRPPWGVQLRRILAGGWGRSTASLEWDQIRRLEQAGVATVEGLAMAQTMAGPWELGSAVLLAELDGESLESYVARRPQRAERDPVMRLADFVRRFHGTGWVHRDLYLCHVFVQAGQGQPVFRLIDLARMFRPRFRVQRWRVKDLAALNYSTPAGAATATDRLRFLKRYLAVKRLGPVERRLARRIARKTASIAGHDARRQGFLGEKAK